MNSKNKTLRQPPEGGWGYLVTAALTLTCIVTVSPLFAFGLIFGKFLSSIGDETTGTALVNSVGSTCFNLAGAFAGSLLQKFTYRVVAFLGAGIFFLGTFATIFVTNLSQMIVCSGIIQGLGLGLMFPAFYTALHAYFDKRLNFMNNISQAFMVTGSMTFPYVAHFLMVTYGFRGTVALISALSLHTILAAAILQPVHWHKKKQPVPDLQLDNREENVAGEDVNTSAKMSGNKGWKSYLNLELFKDPVYVNIALGLALGVTADVAFISLIPVVLMGAGFNAEQVALFMSVFFGSDLIARLLLTAVSVWYKIRNRYLFLGGVFFLMVFRVAFVLNDDFYWKFGTGAVLGFLRCFIQTPVPVVISEQYPDKFSSAFSLYMVVTGIVSLAFGPLMSLIKARTDSDVMVVHLLSLACLICTVSWSVEILYRKKQNK